MLSINRYTKVFMGQSLLHKMHEVEFQAEKGDFSSKKEFEMKTPVRNCCIRTDQETY